MKGMTSLGQIFKEFNDTLNEYQSQPDGNYRKSHVVDSSCTSSKNHLYILLFKAHIECFYNSKFYKMRDNIFHSAESNQGDLAICYRFPSGVRRHALTIELIQQPNFIMTFW